MLIAQRAHCNLIVVAETPARCRRYTSPRSRSDAPGGGHVSTAARRFGKSCAESGAYGFRRSAWEGFAGLFIRVDLCSSVADTMNRERFTQLVREALDALPQRFRARIQNVAVVVEDRPPDEADTGEDLLMGVFEGTPATEKSVWDLQPGPDRVVLYQKNIEAVCDTDDEIREEVRLTVLHELGHYFGMDEDQLEGV